MKGVLSFSYGVIFGAFATVLVLQQTHGLARDLGEPGEATTEIRGVAPGPATATGTDAIRRVSTRGKVAAALSSAGDFLVIPVAGVPVSALRDTYGAARGDRSHTAIDIAAPLGTPVLAAADGSILKLFVSKAGGKTIYLVDRSGEIVYYYAHLDEYERGLAEGQMITRGQKIGTVGTTGNSPKNAPHLHFAIESLPPSREWWKGIPTNPYPILKSRGRSLNL